MHAYPMRYKWYRLAIVAFLCVTFGIGALLYQIYTSPQAELYQTPEFHSTTITVNTSGKIIGEINNQYIGLSFESDTLNSGEFDNVGNLAQLLRNLGNSVMRFGGNSVDKSFQGITSGALAGLVRLAKASGWTVLYSEDSASSTRLRRAKTL